MQADRRTKVFAALEADTTLLAKMAKCLTKVAGQNGRACSWDCIIRGVYA